MGIIAVAKGLAGAAGATKPDPARVTSIASVAMSCPRMGVVRLNLERLGQAEESSGDCSATSYPTRRYAGSLPPKGASLIAPNP